VEIHRNFRGVYFGVGGDIGQVLDLENVEIAGQHGVVVEVFDIAPFAAVVADAHPSRVVVVLAEIGRALGGPHQAVGDVVIEGDGDRQTQTGQPKSSADLPGLSGYWSLL